jgi:hypothetical protein
MEEDKLNYFVSQVALVSECETWEVIHPFSSTLVQVFQNGINIPKYSHAYSNHIFLEPEKQ